MELIKSIPIKNSKVKINSDGCYLYEFSQYGFTEKEFCKWLDGKIMDIWNVNISSSRVIKCPWCGKKPNNLKEHIKEHNKKLKHIDALKLARKSYSILLNYIRNNNYDALAFFINHKCHMCDRHYTKDRKFKCQIAESSRNKMRSFKELGFKCDGFNKEDYPSNTIAIVYSRRPTK